MQVRILIAEDLTEFRQQLRSTLSDQSDFQIVAEASSASQALALASSLRPEFAVVAVGSRALDGIDLTARIVASAPGTNVIVISLHADSRYVDRAIEAGACGYVLKNRVGEDLVPAIRSARRGLSSPAPAA
jgi:DNA-binding NarL/FixJ family response regulator